MDKSGFFRFKKALEFIEIGFFDFAHVYGSVVFFQMDQHVN